MKKRLINNRNQILRVISREDYYAILRFLEEIYLADYDLKIFKARKMSNLYLALKELMLDEDGGRVRIEYKKKYPDPEKEPIVIADWAFDYLEFLYPDREIKSVMLIDDIIIHGRTLANLYHIVEEHFRNAQIKVMTYAKNIEDHLNIPAINDAYAKYVGNIEVCRQYSQIFVDIFMAVNQPYTSYVPNIAIRMNGEENQRDITEDIEKLREWINRHEAVSSLYDDTQRKLPFLKTRVWVGTGGVSNILMPSLRIYHNTESDEYAVVPMVSLKPITNEVLKAQLRIFADNNTYTKRFAVKWQDPDVSVGRMDYRVLVYTMSTLWGRYFFKKRKVFEDYIDTDFEVFEEERMNFGGELLNRESIGQLTEKDLETLFKKIDKEYTEVDCKVFKAINKGPVICKIAELSVTLDKIIEKQWNNENNLELKWEKIVRQFLREDSDQDEDEWKKWVKEYGRSSNPPAPLRIPGLPIILFMEKVNNYEKKIAFKEILKAIDHGEGSIVPEKIEVVGEDKTVYYVSSIHAGEQNYKYAEQKYYSELYGMYLIERNRYNEMRRLERNIHGKEDDVQLAEIEKESTRLKKELLKELEKTQDKYLEKMTEHSVTDEFGKPLKSDFFLHVGEKSLDQVVRLVYGLIGREVPNVY